MFTTTTTAPRLSSKMTEETADLFIQHEEERNHNYEEMAAKYEITVDYYIAEFL